MVVNSVISVFYYVLIVRQMFFVECPGGRPAARPRGVVAVVVGWRRVAVLAVGIFPDLFAQFPQSATLP